MSTHQILSAIGPVLLAATLCGPFQAHAGYANLEITGVVNEIVGTTAVITGSGSQANTNTWNYSSVARFILSGDDGSPAQNPLTVGLEVQPIGATGAFAPNTDSLMIAQTVNSQGLTDSGTLSLYVYPSSNTAWTGEFAFRFYEGTGTTSAFSTPIALDTQITSLDLDFSQRMQLKSDELWAYVLNDPTDVVVTNPSTDLIDFQGLGSAAYNDPEAAVIGQYQGRSEVTLAFSHASVALFMFEFRNPPEVAPMPNPDVTPVPAPPTVALMLGVLAVIPLIRRRRVGTAPSRIDCT